MQTINKKDAITIEVVDTIEQIIIPAEVIKKEYTLADLDEKKEKLVADIARHTEYLKTPQTELDKINGDIAKVQVELDEVNSFIASAIAKGIVAKGIVAEEPLIMEEPIA